MTQQRVTRNSETASAINNNSLGQQDASSFFRNLIWSTEELGAPRPDSSLLHSPQSSPFASIFGLKAPIAVLPAKHMAYKPEVEAKRTQTAEALDLHEYVVQQQNQQAPQPANSLQSKASSHPLAIESSESSPATDTGADSDDDEWVDADSDEDILDSISELISKAWYGSPLPPPLGPYAPSKPRSLLRPLRQSSSSSKDKDSMMPSWLKQPWQGPALLKRSKSRSAKPFGVKFAEQVLGKEAVAAVELIQRDILENPAGDPLPEATIKFFIKAGARVATTWAHSNLNRVFAAFGVYVAATCGAMHYTKRAVKWLAWRLPWGGKKVAGPAVTFTADVLLPTPFFGPWLATYVVLRIIITERNKALAAAKAAEAAEDTPKPQGPTADKPQPETAAAEAPAGSSDDVDYAAEQHQQQEADVIGQQLVNAQKEQQQEQRRQLLRHRTLQRGASTTGRGARLRSRQFLRGRALKAKPLTAAEASAQDAVAAGESIG